MHAEERPVVEARAKNIARSLEQQRRRGAHRRSQQQSQISTREEPQGYLDRRIAKYNLNAVDFLSFFLLFIRFKRSSGQRCPYTNFYFDNLKRIWNADAADGEKREIFSFAIGM